MTRPRTSTDITADASTASTASPQRHADRIFHSGAILDTTRSAPAAAGQAPVTEFVEYEALAVADGVVLAVGTRSEVEAFAGPGTEFVDLGGGAMLPGFIETHIHLGMFGQTLLEVNVRPSAVSSIAEIKDAVAKATTEVNPGEWITGFGWDESGIEEGRGPTRDDLDEVAPDHPVMLRRTCGHMGVANSAALAASGITEDTADPAGGALVRDDSGRLTGLVQETALDLMAVPATGEAETEAGITLAQDAFLASGITTVHDLAAQSEHIRVLSRMRQDRALRVRVRPWMWALDGLSFTGCLDTYVEAGITSGFGDDWVRIQGMKFMLDGSVGGLTAAVAEPYEGTDATGILVADVPQAHPGVLKAVRHGLRAAIHGIGDRAVEVAATVLDQVAAEVPETAQMRCRIEHCALPREADLEIMQRHGIIAGSSVGFLHRMGDRYGEVLGSERMARVYPQRTFIDRGISAPPNSDCPVTEANPWHAISAAVTRTSATGQVLDTAQNITLAEAIHGFTREAAAASFEEDTLGILQAGALADLVVLDVDPRTVPEAELAGVQTRQTYVQGQLAYDAESAAP